MDKWIEILVAGEYPQGNVTVEDLQLMARYYDPSQQQALFIPEHRKFDSNGELINNMAALGWVKAVRYNAANKSLEVLPESVDQTDLPFIYDGKRFKYASAEIETKTIGSQKVPYLGAIAVTNFPASKIQRIKLTGNEDIRVYTLKFNIKKDITMDLKKLCAILKIDENSTIEQVEAAITKLGAVTGANEQLTDLIKLVKESVPGKKEEKTELTATEIAINKLTETVSLVLNKFSSVEENEANAAFDAEVVNEKFLPSQKEILVGTKEKPGAYFKNAAGLKAYAATCTKLVINKTLVIPKDKENKPLTYAQLLKDPVAYAKMQEDAPEAFNQLRNEWAADPTAQTEKKESK